MKKPNCYLSSFIYKGVRLMDFNPSEFFQDIHPFEYQVAGHNTRNVLGNRGILKHKDGYVLKPVNKSPQGDNEISFYERLKQDVELSPIQKFIPDYYGCLCLNLNDSDYMFLKLKDVTDGYFKPCVMDVKIGKQTWEPNATLEKRKAEDVKYAASKHEFGFCIPGYHVHDISSGEVIKFDKDDGKKLEKESTFQAFKQFFNYSSGISSTVLEHVTRQLSELLNWWNSQKVIHIYSSSILLVYDAEKLEEVVTKALKLDELAACGPWVKIYMIDFAHVVPANGTKDFNYICGLSNLIDVLKSIT